MKRMELNQAEIADGMVEKYGTPLESALHGRDGFPVTLVIVHEKQPHPQQAGSTLWVPPGTDWREILDGRWPPGKTTRRRQSIGVPMDGRF